MAQVKIWTRAFLFDSLICFFVNLAYYGTMVVIASYVTTTLEGSLAQAGMASGIFIVGALIARFAIGESIERKGPKRVLWAGILFFLMASVLNIVFLKNFIMLLVLRLFQGLGYGLASTATGTIVAHVLPRESAGTGMSYFTMFVTLGSAIGPYLGTLVYLNDSILYNLIVGIALLLAASLLTAFLSMPEPGDGVSSSNAEESKAKLAVSDDRRGLARIFEPKAVPMAIVTFVTCLGFSGLLSYENIYACSIGLGAFGGLFFVVYAFFTVVSRPFTGRLFDRRGANVTLAPAFVLFAVALVILASATNGAMVLVSAALVGLGFGTYMSCAQAVIIQIAPKEHLGLATSTFFIFMDVATGFCPSFLGMVSGVIGFRGLFFGLAAMTVLALVLYLFLHGRKVKHGVYQG